MSLESITAEWDELSKEYNKLEVGDNVVFPAVCYRRKLFEFYLRASFCDSRTQVMSIMRCWRSLNNCSKNVWKILPINDIVLVKLVAILKSE